MDKLRMTSQDLPKSNVEKLIEIFPNVVTETQDAMGNPKKAIDFDLLRQELSDHIVEGPQERYRLDWPGKRASSFVANAPIAKTLRPIRDESVDFDNTKNLFIEGDNLDALKLLQESYLGKVKMIYIDPPYNTGNDFVYSDDFSETVDEYLVRSLQVDSDGTRLVTNLESNGRFHSDWLSMMYPRLKLARNLLTEDGAIFISIDDSEMSNLQRLASEIFGENNFVGTMVWAAGRKNDSKYISSSHEYILCFARDLSTLRENGVTWKVRKKGLSKIYKVAEHLVRMNHGDFDAASKGLKDWFGALPDSDEAKGNKHYSKVDENGVYFPGDISWPGGWGPRYQVLHPISGKPVKVPSVGWRFQEAAMKEQIKAGRVDFGRTDDSVPTYKRYLHETEFEVPYSVFYQDGRAASKRLKALMGGPVFDFPKDETVIQTLVEMVTTGEDIVLDFFAGSGTTAHAVMAQNAKDGGQRRFVLIQIAEQTNSKSYAHANGFSSISAISRERIRRSAEVVKNKAGLIAESLDTGFRFLTVDTTNLVDVYLTPDNTDQLQLSNLERSIKADRTGEDLLLQVLLDWGLELTISIATETFDGSLFYVIDDGALIASFEPIVSLELVREIASRKPLRVVFCDSSFASDDVRINAEQVLREISPFTDVKVI